MPSTLALDFLPVENLWHGVVPQDPSHSREALFVFRCSKLSCGLEYRINAEDSWTHWDTSMTTPDHGYPSSAPTPSPLPSPTPSASSTSVDVVGYSGSDSSHDEDEGSSAFPDLLELNVTIEANQVGRYHAVVSMRGLLVPIGFR